MDRFVRCCVCVTLSLAFASILLAASWLGGRGPGNAGAYPDTPFPDLPVLVWKTALGDAYSGATPSNGLLAGDVFVVAFGKKLVGVSAETGEVRWTKELADKPLGGLLLVANQIIVTTVDKGVFAYNPEDGKQLWKRVLFSNVANGPLVTDDSLVFATKGATLDVLNPKTGEQITNLEVHDDIDAAPLRIGNSVLLCFKAGQVVRMSGTLQTWVGNLPGATIHRSPVMSGHTVLVCSDDAIYSLNIGSMTKAVAWKYSCPDMVPETVTLESGSVYVATTGGRLHSLDVRSGTEQWGRRGITLPAPPVSSPLVIGDQLFVCMNNGLLATYDKDKGKQTWLYRLAGKGKTVETTTGLPVAQGKHLFFATSDGTVYHLSTLMPDADPPTFRAVLPTLSGYDFSNAKPLQYVGAIIEDEGSGVKADSITMRLDGVDLTPQVQYDLATGYTYAAVPDPNAIQPGMHRLEISATDYHDNQGMLSQLFFVGNSPNSEHLQIAINAQYLPATLKVRPGAILQWVNRGGSMRTVVADNGAFTSDTLYPRGIPDGESWSWVVPTNVRPGTRYCYHCRLLGTAGDGAAPGTGLAGAIEVVDPRNPGPGFPNLNGLVLPAFPPAPF